MCDKVVGDKLCVTKLWVTSCVKEAGREEEDEEEARDRESKTRTPHVAKHPRCVEALARIGGGKSPVAEQPYEGVDQEHAFLYAGKVQPSW